MCILAISILRCPGNSSSFPPFAGIREGKEETRAARVRVSACLFFLKAQKKTPFMPLMEEYSVTGRRTCY